MAFLLVSCGKPSKRPSFPSPSSPGSFENLLLGQSLTYLDVKTILQKLNKEGEWDSLEKWVDSLTPSEFQSTLDFFNKWVFEEAQTSKGLLAILSSWIQKNQFSFLRKNLSPLLPEDLNPQGKLFDLIENLSPALQPSLVSHLLSISKNLKSASKLLPNPKGTFEDLDRLLSNPESRQQLESAFQSFLRSRVWKGIRDSGWEDLAPQIPENLEAIEEALQLADLLNRPSDKIASALQQGLKNNPDLFQALSLKWNPLFVKVLSKAVVEVLLNPEDGSNLDKKFWLSLPRRNEEAPPTESFIRLYSILLSGLSKVSDPLKTDPQMDSGSYRFPLQVSALYLTHLLEEILRQKKPSFELLPVDSFSVEIWDQKIEALNWTWDLSSAATKRDLKNLGLDSVLARLESLLALSDSGIMQYSFSEPLQDLSVKEIFSTGLALSHQIRPLSDINPLLWVFAQSLSDLEFLKTSPNILNQIQGALSQLSPSQWDQISSFLFNDLKVASLEPEDKILIVSLFQSDPEVAEWVALVFEKLSSLSVLESKSFLTKYFRMIRKLSTEEQGFLGDFLSGIARLEILNLDENKRAQYPGIRQWFESPEAIQNGVQSVSKCPPEALDYLVMETEMEKNFELYSLFLPLLRRVTTTDWSSFEIGERETAWLYRFVKEGGLKEVKTLHLQRAPLSDLQRLIKKGDFSKGMWLLSFIKNERMKEVAIVFRSWDLSGELQAALDIFNQFRKESEK